MANSIEEVIIVDTDDPPIPLGGTHVKEVFSDRRLYALKKRNALTDITLVAGPRNKRIKIRAHRAILALASQYFWNQFVEESTEKDSELNVFGADPSVLEILVEYIYTGHVQLTEENVEKLYGSAKTLGVEGFQEKCQEFLTANIDDSNWYTRLTFARHQNMYDLTDVVLSHISSDYTRYVQSPQFLDLPLEEVLTVLNNPTRLEHPEETIFSSVVKWLKHEKARVRHAATLLEEIDLTSLPEDFLVFHFDTEEVLRSIECLEIARRILKKPSFQKSLPDTDTDEEVFIFPEPATNKVQPKPKVIKTEAVEEKSEEPATRGKRRGRKSKKGRGRSLQQEEAEEEAPPEKRSKSEEEAPPEKRSKPEEVTEPKPEPVTPVSPVRSIARKKTGGLRRNYEAIKAAAAAESKKSDADVASRTSKTSKTSKNSEPSTIKITPSASATSKAEEVDVPLKGPGSNSSKGTVYKIIYLRDCHNDDARVMMTDLCQKHPQQLRPFVKCNKNTSLLWVSEVRKMYALGGVATLLSEKGSSNLVRISPEANLLKNSDKEKYWLKGPSMVQERTNFTPVIIGDYIYAIGGAEGICGNEAVNVAERLNVKNKNAIWEEIDYLNRARQGYGAGVIDGKIYACGGYGAEDAKEDSSMGILSTVERYDPAEDKWTLVSSMISERHGLSVAVLDSKLYAIGGGGLNSHTDFSKDLDTMMSVEMYDPKENCWNKVASMNRPRRNGSAVVLNGKIYAIGGDVSKGEGQYKSSVEVYSPTSDKWQLITEELDPDGVFTSVAVIDLKS